MKRAPHPQCRWQRICLLSRNSDVQFPYVREACTDAGMYKIEDWSWEALDQQVLTRRYPGHTDAVEQGFYFTTLLGS